MIECHHVVAQKKGGLWHLQNTAGRRHKLIADGKSAPSNSAQVCRGDPHLARYPGLPPTTCPNYVKDPSRRVG